MNRLFFELTSEYAHVLARLRLELKSRFRKQAVSLWTPFHKLVNMNSAASPKLEIRTFLSSEAKEGHRYLSRIYLVYMWTCSNNAQLSLQCYFQYVWTLLLGFRLPWKDRHGHEEYKGFHLSELCVCMYNILYHICICNAVNMWLCRNMQHTKYM